jgi:F0F1-type ATP synthase delta subunit
MTKKDIKSLATVSFTGNNLDEKKVNRIIKYLNRHDLKQYIKTLKTLEKQKNVYIYLSHKDNNLIISELKQIFKNKNVVTMEDKSLIAGIKVVDNDLVFEQNIKNNLNNLANNLN